LAALGKTKRSFLLAGRTFLNGCGLDGTATIRFNLTSSGLKKA
jgi:hypothetical protein